jgi:serine/threonine protein kinase
VSIGEQSTVSIGPYVLGQVLGRGGMGVVYRATHVHLGREVALKLLAPELNTNDEFRGRFLRESRLAASLDHPNVITVYDAGDFNGTLYIAMRYVEGVDLAQLLRKQGRLDPLAALSLLDQVADALDAAHEHGLIHRDVKPANVMIASGRCYLTDFGLTKDAGASPASAGLTRTGMFLGTLHYAAPEQIEGAEVTAATDIYALGCVLYECLTGTTPFTKETDVALMFAHVSEMPRPPSELRPDLPAALDEVVAKAMAKSPQDRYATCGELIAAARAAVTPQGQPGVPGQPASSLPSSQGPGTATLAGAPPTRAASRPPSPSAAWGLPPDAHHYDEVIRYMVDQGTVVPLLGGRVSGMLPDAAQIAADLAQSFGIEADDADLPRVAQQVYVSVGRPDLVRRLRQILAGDCVPSPVHRFLARVPRQLEELGLPPRYQMIMTTNYDANLERAFDEENEPYDLAVYVASGPDRGHFVHCPSGGDPEPIAVPNRYDKFPINDYGELERTVIMKIHGGVTGESFGYSAKDNFVITEDHYIDYLSSNPIESLVPVQILAKLTDSHCLFLGYSMRDWNLRVFLKRIWQDEPLGSKSWAVQRDPDFLEKDFWSQAHVEFFAAPLDKYVEELHRRVLARGVPA